MNIKHVPGRIIVLVDREQKYYHTFSFGVTIRYERNWNNLDYKETGQSLGTVVSSDLVPEGAMVLFHHNNCHPSNEIFNHGQISGEDIASGIRLYSFPKESCFLWKMPEEMDWQPIPPFETALRVYKPYQGLIEGIEPTQIPNVLYVTSGEFRGQVVRTLKACDFPIIFRNEQGAEQQIIRFRPNGDEKTQREPEATVIDHELTEKVWEGLLPIGISPSKCKSLHEGVTT